MRWNSGDLLSLSRIQIETASRIAESRNGMRQPQSPNAASPIAGADAEDQQQRHEQAERRGGLNPRRVIAALVRRRVFGDVDRRAAIFAAERKALHQAQADQHDRREDAPGRDSRAARR